MSVSCVTLEMWLAEGPSDDTVYRVSDVSTRIVSSFTLFFSLPWPLPLPFSGLVAVATTAFVRPFQPAIFAQVASTSTREATRRLSVDSLGRFPMAVVAVAPLRQGIDLRVVWATSAAGRCHACVVLHVVLQELRDHCRHLSEAVQGLHLEW